jgi:hypothetical protein
MIALLLLSGCWTGTDEQTGAGEQPGIEEPIETDERPGTDELPVIAPNGTPAPMLFDNLNQFFAEAAVAKFYETDRFNGHPVAQTLREIWELYMPLNSTPNFELNGISMLPTRSGRLAPIDIGYSLADYCHCRGPVFRWHCERDPEAYRYPLVLTDYGMEVLHWTQHGYLFEARVPRSLSAADLASFQDAQPVDAWELRGDAVSVSIQGMAEAVILDERGDDVAGIATERGRRWLWLAGEHFLYSHDNEVIGYQWLIDERTNRYQYVLEPGTYTFHASGATGEPGLVVRHFTNGEEVSTVDFAAELSGQDISGFTVTVTAEPKGSSLELDNN